jgi:hypothetical protein
MFKSFCHRFYMSFLAVLRPGHLRCDRAECDHDGHGVLHDANGKSIMTSTIKIVVAQFAYFFYVFNSASTFRTGTSSLLIWLFLPFPNKISSHCLSNITCLTYKKNFAMIYHGV